MCASLSSRRTDVHPIPGSLDVGFDDLFGVISTLVEIRCHDLIIRLLGAAANGTQIPRTPTKSVLEGA
jgi:hypothetical protein